jgi:GMP synthase (glutamine-hydrolysing)
MILVLDNEVRPEYRYLGPEIAHFLPDPEYHVLVEDPDYPSLDGFDGVVLSGSTDSVYDEDHGEWFDAALEVVDRCLADRIPLLGVCHGHQLVNHALGGVVEEDRRRATFVEMTDYRESGVLEGVNPVVPVLHADLVAELGEGMASVAETDYDPHFCSVHREAPVWTVQFHPEFTERVVDRPGDWDPGEHTFTEVNASRVLENFTALCASEAEPTVQ